MSKEIITQFLQEAKNSYTWNLYFLNYSKKRGQDVMVYESAKKRFSNHEALVNYVKSLINSVIYYQLEKSSDVEVYTGYNSKNVCDKLQITDELIHSNYSAFNQSLINNIESDRSASYKGYVIDGQSGNGVDSVSFIKLANPVVSISDKRSVAFKINSQESLDIIDGKICRLYLNVDSLRINSTLYNFTDNFERMFNVPSTRQNIKTRNIETILAADIISNPDEFKSQSTSIDARILQEIHPQRFAEIQRIEHREEVSRNYNIPLDQNGKFIPESKEQYTRLIRYLGYKTFQDAETMDILTANSVTKENLN